MKALRVFALVLAMASISTPALAADHCANGRSRQGAMWLSILHPGLGEYFLKGWGDFKKAPPKKFWLGFIPLFGWPGYLQVVSATDAMHCRTGDWKP